MSPSFTPRDWPLDARDGARRAASSLPLLARDEACAVLDALPAAVAVLDRHGTIVSVNEAWRRARHGGHGLPMSAVGANYLAVCDAAAAREPAAGSAAHRIREAILGCDDELRTSFPCSEAGEGGGDRWFLLQVTAFGEGEGRRVVVLQEDVSGARPAELALGEVTALLLVAQDEERRRIARELHDGTAPTLVAVSLDLARLAGALAPGEQRELALSCVSLCEQALCELRTVSFVLHPPLLERDGLVESLRRLVDGFGKRSGIRVSLETTEAPPEQMDRLGADAELALYRVVQEALTNVHRHSVSRTARVSLAAAGRELRLTVSDDGTPRERWSSGGVGVGLASMRERLQALGGRLDLAAGRAGAVLTAIVPLDR